MYYNTREIVDRIKNAALSLTGEELATLYNQIFDEEIAYIGDELFSQITSNEVEELLDALGDPEG